MVDSDSSTGVSGGQNPPGDVHAGGHGSTTAAWVSVTVIMFGALLMSIAVLISSVVLFVLGVLVVIGGAVAAKVLTAMGYGSSGRSGEHA